MFSNAVSRWAGWVLAHPEFGSSVNPIPTRWADYVHHSTACPPGFENPTASLHFAIKNKIDMIFTCGSIAYNLNIELMKYKA